MEERELFKIIGKNVKYYRKLFNLNNSKLTQEDLAEKINVSTSLIGNLESDRITQGISVITLYKISNALKTPIEKFFENK